MKLVIISTTSFQENEVDVETAEREIKGLMKDKGKYWLYLDGKPATPENLSAARLTTVKRAVLAEVLFGG